MSARTTTCSGTTSSSRIWNKTGTPLVGPIDGNELFQPGTPCGDNNDGDPIILYDSYAGRWNGSQFAAPNGTSSGPFYQCIAISTTNDPTGTWCSYNFQVHPNKFNDYPKMAVWPAQNAYMMTAPQFPDSRRKRWPGRLGLRAHPDARVPAGSHGLPGHVHDRPEPPADLAADADGATPPPAGAPAPIVGMNFDGSGTPADQLQVCNATIDWVPPTPTISVVKEGDLQAAPYDSSLCNYIGSASRSRARREARRRCPTGSCTGSSTATSAPGSRWSSNHSVDVEERPRGSPLVRAEKQAAASGRSSSRGPMRPRRSPSLDGRASRRTRAATSPSATRSRRPRGTFPGIRYAGRLNTDPPGTLAQGEAS